jgi:creatinine amidohydrolase/Fe(II)-dependent formamide hydrolase-like protein
LARGVSVTAGRLTKRAFPFEHPTSAKSLQIHGFDRERRSVILTLGMIEEHGLHLPVGADTFGVMYDANGA